MPKTDWDTLALLGNSCWTQLHTHTHTQVCQRVELEPFHPILSGCPDSIRSLIMEWWGTGKSERSLSDRKMVMELTNFHINFPRLPHLQTLIGKHGTRRCSQGCLHPPPQGASAWNTSRIQGGCQPGSWHLQCEASRSPWEVCPRAALPAPIWSTASDSRRKQTHNHWLPSLPGCIFQI